MPVATPAHAITTATSSPNRKAAGALSRVTRLIVIACCCAYPFLMHYAALHGTIRLATALPLGVVTLTLLLVLRGAWKWLALIGPAAILLPVHKSAWLFHVTPVAIYLCLAVLFGHTLRPGRVPLITRFAALERDPLPDEIAAYTRRLTWIWTLFFILMAMTATALSLFAPLTIWSLFTNFVSYVLTAALFFGEYVYRRIRYAHYEHLSLRDMIRLVRDSRVLPWK